MINCIFIQIGNIIHKLQTQTRVVLYLYVCDVCFLRNCECRNNDGILYAKIYKNSSISDDKVYFLNNTGISLPIIIFIVSHVCMYVVYS